MNLNQDQLTELEQLAGMLIPIPEIAVSMSLDPDKLQAAIRSVNSAEHLAYFKGYLETIAKHNATVIHLASQGSTPAQNMLEKMLVNVKIEKIRKNYGW